MLNLSNVSIKRVMECVDGHWDNRTTLCDLRRSCFRINKVAVHNDFHRLKASLTLVFFNNDDIPDEKMAFAAFIGRGTSDFVRAQHDYANVRLDWLSHMERRDMVRIREAADVFDPWNNDQGKKYTFDESASTLDTLIKQAIGDAQLKLRSIDALKLVSAVLDTELLHTLKKCSSQICSANTFHIDNCIIKWTVEELSEFLRLFESLKNIQLSGKFDKPIVTDEHLSLVADHIIVCNEQYNVASFPGITSKSCKNWLKNGIKQTAFENMDTGLSINNITDFLNEFIIKKPNQGLWAIMNMGCRFNFGKLQCSEYREVVLAQRNKDTEWTLLQSDGNPNTFQVTYKESQVTYAFQIDRPYENPDFAKLLEMIHLLRGEAEVDAFDMDRLSSIEERATKINLQLIDYQRRNDLPQPQYQLDYDEFRVGLDEFEEEINDDNFPRFRRRQILAAINRIERVIRQTMKQVEEPVPNLAAEVIQPEILRQSYY